jgi:AraC family transcriptional regulator
MRAGQGLVVIKAGPVNRGRRRRRRSVFTDRRGRALAARAGRTYLTLLDELAGGLLSPIQQRMVTEMIEQSLERGIALADLAAACGLSVGHFSRAFRRTHGMPPHRWLLHRRVEKAKILLLNRRVRIAEVAAMCGFADQSHLTRVFARLAGQSPGRWRQENTSAARPWTPAIAE